MREVLRLAHSFAIQVDNLCQFLPQDKVSEFAALTPIELLNSTQRAAAGAEMVELHENLKSLRAEQKSLQSNNEADRDLLSNLEDRQEMQRADVERVRQRAQIKKQIEVLEMVRPVVHYKELHRKFNAAKQERRDCQRELEELEAELEPVMRSVKEKEGYCKQIDDVIKHKQRKFEAAERAATDIGKKVEQYEQSMKDMEAEIEAEKKSSVNYRQEGIKITQTINRLNRQLNEEPIEFDANWYNDQIVSVETETINGQPVLLIATQTERKTKETKRFRRKRRRDQGAPTTVTGKTRRNNASLKPGRATIARH